VTFRATKHLDGKHTVFGNLVGGSDVLSKIEQVSTDTNDKPQAEIRILQTTVHVNPFSEEELAKEADEERRKQRLEAEKNEMGRWYSNPSGLPAMTSSSSSSSSSTTGVGKYLSPSNNPDAQSAASKKRALDFGVVASASKRQKQTESQYGNFSGF
jgi:peptidyl-prolyl cis-trans isomerase-like 2